MCTLLLRGALHKDHFSKITTWLPFIPYFWKPSCFLRLPLLPLFLQPPPHPPPPHPSLSCFSFHMLVLFFLIFPLCKKWKAENRMSEGVGKKKAGGKSSDCTSVKSLSAVLRPLFLCTDSYGLQYRPATTSIYITLRKAKPHPQTVRSAALAQRCFTVCQCDILTAWQEERHWSATGSCTKNIL